MFLLVLPSYLTYMELDREDAVMVLNHIHNNRERKNQ